MLVRENLLTQTRLAKLHYSEPHAGEVFAEIEEHLTDVSGSRIPRWLPNVFQHILDDFTSLDDVSRTDFLSCLLRLSRKLAINGQSLRLDKLRDCLSSLPSWDAELASELIKIETTL